MLCIANICKKRGSRAALFAGCLAIIFASSGRNGINMFPINLSHFFANYLFVRNQKIFELNKSLSFQLHDANKKIFPPAELLIGFLLLFLRNIDIFIARGTKFQRRGKRERLRISRCCNRDIGISDIMPAR